VTGSFEPGWLRVAVLVAVVLGVIAAAWLFGVLAKGPA
jgi:hypothetical protein